MLHSIEADEAASLKTFPAELIVLAHGEPGAGLPRSGNSGVQPFRIDPITALEPLIESYGGLWIAHGAERGESPAPPKGRRGDGTSSRYRVARVPLSADDLQGYHEGFASEALWPLCHRTYVRPTFRSNDLETAWDVNARFAAAACDAAATATPLVLVHGHHLALAPSIVRERLPGATIVTFWHLPWPDWQTFEICPWRQQILESLLRSTVIGFQTTTDCRNFVDSVEHAFEARFDRSERAVVCGGRRIYVRSYPTSVGWTATDRHPAPSGTTARQQVCELFGLPADVHIGVAVDTLDPGHGVEERMLALERVLDAYPELARKLVFVQLALAGARRGSACAEQRQRVRAAAERVNKRFGDVDYCPVVLVEGTQAEPDVLRLLRAADFCHAASLHDGMSLLAKTFVRERDDDAGVLLLGEFSGAARELTGALLVNPYDVDGTASAIAAAVSMDASEQASRMRRMRQIVCDRDAFRWAADVLTDAVRLGGLRQEAAPFAFADERHQTMMPLRTA